MLGGGLADLEVHAPYGIGGVPLDSAVRFPEGKPLQ